MLEVLSPTGGTFWIGLGLLLMILEVLDGNFVLFSLGLGALITSVFGFVGIFSLVGLLVLCAGSELAVFLLLRPVVMRSLRSRSARTNVDALIGMRGVVTSAIGEAGEAGYVKVQGELWRAVSANDRAVAEGARVVVRDVSGATLSVLPEELGQAGDRLSGRVSIARREP